jgi:GTPase SAR1 family protein
MEEFGLGPNGAILYCIEYLEANFDWLVEQLDELLGEGGDGYVIFDTPGQVELWTNHDSLKNIVEKLQKMDYRVSPSLLAFYYSVDEIAGSGPSIGCSLYCRCA